MLIVLFWIINIVKVNFLKPCWLIVHVKFNYVAYGVKNTLEKQISCEVLCEVLNYCEVIQLKRSLKYCLPLQIFNMYSQIY